MNLIVSDEYPLASTIQKKKKLNQEEKLYIWDEPFLFKQGVIRVVRRCIPESEITKVLESCHSSPYGGHHEEEHTAHKALQSGFFWPTLFKDSIAFVKVATSERIGYFFKTTRDAAKQHFGGKNL